MIANKEQTDLKREGYIAAMQEARGGSGFEAEAAAKYPYQQARVITVDVDGVPTRFMVQIEDLPDEYAVGTLLCATMAKRATWGRAHAWVSSFTPDGLRKIADLLENPTEPYVEPKKVAEVVIE